MARRKAKAWRPDYGAPSGPQRRFLVELGHVFELINVGEVGSAKTDAALMGPVVYPEYRQHPRFKALILRHSDGNKVKTSDAFSEFYQRVDEPGRWRRYVGGRLNRTKGFYRFRSGGLVLFTSTRDLRSLQGPEFQYVFFDELTHWPTAADYLYACFTRARSADGLPIRIRATTNPGGPGHAWVRARWGPWLASDYLSVNAEGHDIHPGAASLRALGYLERHWPDGRLRPPVDQGVVLHFMIEEGGEDRYVPAGTPGALTRSCLRTKTSDNIALSKHDPTYKMRTRAVGATLGAQLGEDNWDIRSGGGKIFQRIWFPIVPAAPPLLGVCRRWDFAWTKKKRSKWSVGVKLGWTANGIYPVVHIVRLRGNPEEVFAVVEQTAIADGLSCPVVVPIDYAAGLVVVSDVVRKLAGYQVKSTREQGRKEERIATLDAPAAAGRIPLVQGAWNLPFLDEAEDYEADGTGFNDQLDALAGAYLYACEHGRGMTIKEATEALESAVDTFQRAAPRDPLAGWSL